MGLKSESATFQSAINSVLAVMNDLRSFCYMEEVINAAESLESKVTRDQLGDCVVQM
jgi:hypothetical protein